MLSRFVTSRTQRMRHILSKIDKRRKTIKVSLNKTQAVPVVVSKLKAVIHGIQVVGDKRYVIKSRCNQSIEEELLMPQSAQEKRRKQLDYGKWYLKPDDYGRKLRNEHS